MVKVYVKGLVTEDHARRIRDALRLIPVEEVAVADDCTVTFTPKE